MDFECISDGIPSGQWAHINLIFVQLGRSELYPGHLHVPIPGKLLFQSVPSFIAK